MKQKLIALVGRGPFAAEKLRRYVCLGQGAVFYPASTRESSYLKGVYTLHLKECFALR